MIWDWNHVVNVKLHGAMATSKLIPTTGMSDMVLMHKDCDKCWSMHGSKWIEDGEIRKAHGGENGTMTLKFLEYFYMAKLRSAQTKGWYYFVDACLWGEVSACARGLVATILCIVCRVGIGGESCSMLRGLWPSGSPAPCARTCVST